MRQPQSITPKPDHTWPAFEAIDPKPVVARRDGEHGAGIRQVHVPFYPDAESASDRELMARDGREKGLRTGEPLAIALAALFDLALLIACGHRTRAGRPARASASTVSGSPCSTSCVSGRSE